MTVAVVPGPPGAATGRPGHDAEPFQAGRRHRRALGSASPRDAGRSSSPAASLTRSTSQRSSTASASVGTTTCPSNSRTAATIRSIKWIRNQGTIPYINDVNGHGEDAINFLRAIENCSDAEAWELVRRVMADKGWARACFSELSISDIKNLICQHAGDKTLSGKLSRDVAPGGVAMLGRPRPAYSCKAAMPARISSSSACTASRRSRSAAIASPGSMVSSVSNTTAIGQ